MYSEKEISRTTGVMNIVSDFGPLLREAGHDVPVVMAVALLTWGNHDHVMERWNVDPDALAQEGVALLQRHLEIFKWMIATVAPLKHKPSAVTMVEIEQAVRDHEETVQKIKHSLLDYVLLMDDRPLDFVSEVPEHKSFVRSVAVLQSTNEHRDLIRQHRFSAMVGIGLLCNDRPPQNVVTMWSIDQEATINEIVSALQEHASFIRWLASLQSHDKFPEELLGLVSLSDLILFERSLRDRDKLKADILLEFPLFMQWAEK